MAIIITHNIDAVIKQLDTYQRSHLPKAASQALKSFGFDSRELLQAEMDKKYGSVSSYTRRSPYFHQRRYELLIGISDKSNSGVPPRQYLSSTDASKGRFRKPVTPTSLDGALAARYGFKQLATPVASSRAGRQLLNAQGALKPRKVQRLLDALRDPNSSAEKYFLIPPGTSSHLPAGIFRRYKIKNQISMVFALQSKPTRTPTLDYHGVVLAAAQKELPRIISSKLSRLLRG